jgi:hypothetical protein
MVLLSAAPSQGVAATQLAGIFGGGAFGTFANATAGRVATTLGRSAYIITGCKGTGGVTRFNEVDGVDAGRVLSVQVIRTTAYTNKTATNAALTTTAKVSGLRALDGRITADAVQAVADVSASASKIGSTSRRSTFTNLRVLGQPVASSVPNNTRLDIPGFGYIVLKEVVQRGDGVNTGSININMIKIVITQANSLNLPVGSQIVVSHADGSYTRTTASTLVGGYAFAASAKSSVATVENRVGRAAAIYLGCLGTGGRTRSNNVNEIQDTGTPPILSSGTGKTTAYGNRTTTETTAILTASVQNLNLLGGRITADAVKGVAKSTYSSTGGAGSTEGSSFINLKVLGVAVSVPVAPNTRVELPGLGYAILYQRAVVGGPTGGRAGVNMIHVFINTNNSLGLPVGTEIFVATANSNANRF